MLEGMSRPSIRVECVKYFVSKRRSRGFLNDMRYINPRFTYLLTYLLFVIFGKFQSALRRRLFLSTMPPKESSKSDSNHQCCSDKF